MNDKVLVRNNRILDLIQSGRLVTKVEVTSTDGFRYHRSIATVYLLDGQRYRNLQEIPLE